MLVDVEVAAGDELEVEPAVEGEQREQMVEEADPGRDTRTPLPVEIERDAERGLGGRADDERGACRVRARAQAQRQRDEDPVVLGRRDGR